MRDLEKERSLLLKNKALQKILTAAEFANLSEDELTLLREKKHKDLKKQARFDFAQLCVSRVKEIDKELALLKSK